MAVFNGKLLSRPEADAEYKPFLLLRKFALLFTWLFKLLLFTVLCVDNIDDVLFAVPDVNDLLVFVLGLLDACFAAG
jgi:hypothetical protein